MLTQRMPSSSRRIALLLGTLCLASWFRIPATANDASKPTVTKPAPKPLYRDPVHDGAADPSVVWNRAKRKWMMFYTNRRADFSSTDPKDVAWVHGTKIGMAESADGGTTWKYAGTADIPYGGPDYTFWAPELIWNHSTYHMFVSVVPGIFHDWNAPREIIHLTSPDLTKWTFVSKLPLSSDRVIDPCVLRLDDGTWRLWYKDERDHSFIHFVNSTDLDHWTTGGIAINDRPSEGPIVFRWQGKIWMIVDAWKGLGVYKSTDALHWERQEENLLADAGELPTDRAPGQHADVQISGDRAFLFYFVHQRGLDMTPGVLGAARHTVIQVVELKYKDDKLIAHRNKPTLVRLDVPGAD